MKIKVSFLLVFLMVGGSGFPNTAQADSKTLAFHLTAFFRASRATVNKALITDPTAQGDADAFATKFLKKTKSRYTRKTSDTFSEADPIKKHLVDAIREVITKAVKGEYKGQFKYQ